MKTNKAVKKDPIYTYEGGKASRVNELEQLKRATMSCLLWEDNFYEDGVSIADRITSLVKACIDKGLYDDVIETLKKVKFDMKIRHCPLWMIVAIYKVGKTVDKNVIASILTRPDDMGELLSLYRKDNDKAPIPNAFKKGMAIALQKFDEYQLAKYSRDANYKLVDIVNLCHPKVTEAIDKLVKGTLETPKTWEVGLSAAGKDENAKKAVWEDLMKENKLGGMAFLKNIRGMLNVGVSNSTVKEYLKNIKANKLMPIDFIRAAQNNPTFENEIESKFFESFTNIDKMEGRTAVLVDVSGSMSGDRAKYAEALAMIGRELCESVDTYSFSNDVILVPNRRGFALADAINKSQYHSGTYLWKAVNTVQKGHKYDRLIVITDEQSMDSPVSKKVANAYIINVSPYKTGVGYDQGYVHINGFSDKVFEYIKEYESDK